MAQLEIDTAVVTRTAAAVSGAASGGSSQGITVTTPASDPVSAAVTETLQARCAAITGYSNFAQVITEARGSMLASSASTYDEQEQLNAASLGSAGGDSAAPASAAPSVPNLSTPTIPAVTAPQLGAPPTNGKDIARLLHGGPGPAGLYSAAQQMRSHASELQDAARQLRRGSTAISADWRSGAGDQASQRIIELSQWYERHGEHATATATALETLADNYARARANTPKPEEFEDTEQRLKRAAQANANPANMGRYAPVVAALQTELGGLHAKATTQYADYARSAGNPSLVGAPLEPPPRPGTGGIHALDAPLSPAPGDIGGEDGGVPDSSHGLVDPHNPFIGDERFGQWRNYTPPPYVGSQPPPPPAEHFDLTDQPLKTGGPSGFYTPGQTWVTPDQQPAFSQAEQYRFRMSGMDGTTYTRVVTVDGQPQLQRWFAYTYDSQKWTQTNLNLPVWARTAPDPIGGVLGGTASDTIGASLPSMGPWQPTSPAQIAVLSAANPGVTYYIPDGCGGQFIFQGGVPIGGTAPAPSPPSMTAPR